MAYDINRLRQQNLMANYGMPDIMNYQDAQSFAPFQMPPSLPIEEGLPPPQIPQVTPFTQFPPPPKQEDSIADLVNQFYTPETRSRDRLNNLLDTTPERQDPGIARRIAASAAALKGGPDAAERFMYAPHMREMADWKEKTGPFQAAATGENAANINERTLAGNIATTTVNQRRFDAQNQIAEEKNRIAKIRADAYSAKQNGYTIKVEGDRVIATHPTTLKRVDLGPSGGLDESDKLNIEGMWDAAAAKQRADSTAANTQTAGAMFVMGPDGKLYAVNPRTNPTGAEDIPKGPVNRLGTPDSTTPRDIATERANTFQSVYDNYPQYRKYLVPPTSSGASWQLADAPTPGMWSNKEKEIQEYNEVRRLLSGQQPTPTPVQSTPPPSTGNQPIGGSNKVPTPGISQSEQRRIQERTMRGDVGPSLPRPPTKPKQAPIGGTASQQRAAQEKGMQSELNNKKLINQMNKELPPGTEIQQNAAGKYRIRIPGQDWMEYNP